MAVVQSKATMAILQLQQMKVGTFAHQVNELDTHSLLLQCGWHLTSDAWVLL